MTEIPQNVRVVPIEALTPGSILFVQVGLTAEEMGDVPWIPSPDELEEIGNVWRERVPDGVDVIVSHVGVDVGVMSYD